MVKQRLSNLLFIINKEMLNINSMKMKKILGGLLLLCGAQWVYAGGYITITDKPYYVDTLEHKVVAPEQSIPPFIFRICRFMPIS